MISIKPFLIFSSILEEFVVFLIVVAIVTVSSLIGESDVLGTV